MFALLRCCRISLLLLVLERSSAGASLSKSGLMLAVLSASGALCMQDLSAVVAGADRPPGTEESQKRGMVRRQGSRKASVSMDGMGMEFVQEQVKSYGVTGDERTEKKNQKFYGVTGDERTEKIGSGTAYTGDPWAIGGGKHANVDASGNVAVKNGLSTPAWAPHESMPTMPTCVQDVTSEMGLSDYGTISHSCTACQRNCTEENMQQATNMTWLFEPTLETCNAFDIKLYMNWSNIDQLGCSQCSGKGLRHKFEFKMATNAGVGISGYEESDLSFDGWFGAEVSGGPRGAGSDFSGLHVIEIWDTELPSHSTDCNHPNPPGRWLAVPGELRAGETFQCERICTDEGRCHCGRNTAMRCTARIAMGSGQLFGYRMRSIAESATATMDANSYVGTEWEITAEDLSQLTPVQVLGRVVLAGNAGAYGIKDIRQSHQHMGCVPCDLFYESTIVTGPFITDPPGVHAIRSADGDPPMLTAESCELFRMASLGGFAVKFETGPGLWPPFEVNDTIFTCDHVGTNTCPA